MSTLKCMKSENQNATFERSYAQSDNRSAIRKLQSELPEEAYPPAAPDGKTILVPQVQSMKDYVILHYKKPLCRALCKWISGNPTSNKPAEPFSDTCTILDMSEQGFDGSYSVVKHDTSERTSWSGYGTGA